MCVAALPHLNAGPKHWYRRRVEQSETHSNRNTIESNHTCGVRRGVSSAHVNKQYQKRNFALDNIRFTLETSVDWRCAVLAQLLEDVAVLLAMGSSMLTTQLQYITVPTQTFGYNIVTLPTRAFVRRAYAFCVFCVTLRYVSGADGARSYASIRWKWYGITFALNIYAEYVYAAITASHARQITRGDWRQTTSTYRLAICCAQHNIGHRGLASEW